MSHAKIVIYGTDWCGDCYRARRIMETHNIPFQWIDIDQDQEAEQFVLSTNSSMRIVPTILFEDGSLLVEPSNRQLKEKLGISGYSKKSIKTPS